METGSTDRLETIFNEYLNTLPTKLAQHQSKKALSKATEFNGVQTDVKGVVNHYLSNEGYNVFIKTENSKKEYFIGDKLGSVIDLNKTTFNFANYLVTKGYTNPNVNVYDYATYLEQKANDSKPEWLVKLESRRITDVLLSEENFGHFTHLVSYIKGVQMDSSKYNTIYAIYNKKTFVLDVFDGDVQKNVDLLVICNVTLLFKKVFKNSTVGLMSKHQVLDAIEEAFKRTLVMI